MSKYVIYFPHGTEYYPTPNLYWRRETARVRTPLEATMLDSVEEARHIAFREWAPHEFLIMKVTAVTQVVRDE